jgi:hypothetical protein
VEDTKEQYTLKNQPKYFNDELGLKMDRANRVGVLNWNLKESIWRLIQNAFL